MTDPESHPRSALLRQELSKILFIHDLLRLDSEEEQQAALSSWKPIFEYPGLSAKDFIKRELEYVLKGLLISWQKCAETASTPFQLSTANSSLKRRLNYPSLKGRILISLKFYGHSFLVLTSSICQSYLKNSIRISIQVN